MKLKYNFTVQQIADSFCAVAIGEDSDKFHSLIRMNETGKEIFIRLQNGTTRDDIIKDLTEIYEGDRAIIESRVDEFILNLKNQGVLDS